MTAISFAGFEVVSRDGGGPYFLISDDPRLMWQTLRCQP